MKTVTIDCFGNRNDREPDRFMNPRGEKHAHAVDAQSGVTYVAFDRVGVTAQPIHKITTTGTVTLIWWGYGSWANRANLDYDLTKNEPRNVEVAD